MATNAEVVFRLKADTSRIKKDLGKLEGQGKSIDKTFTNSPFFSGAIAGAAMAGVNRIIDGLSAMGREAFRVSDGWTKLDMFMTNALDSSQKEIDDTISMLRELARMSIYSPDDMIQGFERLKLAGVEAADEVIKGFVDMAASLGTSSQSFQSFMIQFGQAVSKGSLKWVDLRIMMEQAPEIVDAIAKSMGTTSAGFLQMAQDGGVAIDQIIDALLKGEKGFKKFEGGATQAPKTFEAAWGAARESIVNKISDIIDVLGKEEMLKAITKTGDTVVDVFDKIQKLLEFLIKHKEAVKNFVTGFTAFASALKTLSIIDNVVKGVKALAVAETELSIVQGIVSATNPFGWIGLAIAAAIALVALIVANFDTIKKVIGNVGNTITTFFANVGTTVGAIFSGIFASIGQFFGDVGAIMGVLLQPITEGIALFFNPFVEFVKGIFNVIMVFIQGFVGVFVGTFNVMVAQTKSAISLVALVFQVLYTTVSTIFGNILKVGQVVFGQLLQAGQAVFNGIAFVAGVVVSPIVSTFKMLSTAVSSIFGTMAKAVGDNFKVAAETIKFIFNGVVNFLKGIMNGIISGINLLIDGVNLLPFHDKIAHVKKLAQGGIATRATHAIFGEAGPEAVVPLTPRGISKFTEGIGVKSESNKEITNIYNINAEYVDEKWLMKLMKREALAQGW